jgi:hypothetical protein
MIRVPYVRLTKAKPIVREKTILSSEKLRKTYNRKGSVARKKYLIVNFKGFGVESYNLTFSLIVL